jgi:sugar/nucleoside kinase (ribokinase family)
MNEDKIFDVLAIGELNADLIFTGLKHGPVLNREIIAENYQKTLGSSTALCACNIARIGLKVAFCGKVGNDEMGHYVLKELKNRNIDTGFCKIDSGVETGVTLSLNWHGDRAMVTVLGAISAFSQQDFDINILKSSRHLHVGSFFLQSGLRKDLEIIFKTARDWGITTSLDAGWDDTENWDYGIASVLKYTDIFFPNETEALHITKTKDFEEAAAILEKISEKTVCVKRGSRGAYCLSGGKRYAIDAMADVKVVDTTGAGDSFNAGFIYAFIKGFSVPECLEFGNACGNICVATVGGTNADLRVEKVMETIQTHEKSCLLS